MNFLRKIKKIKPDVIISVVEEYLDCHSLKSLKNWNYQCSLYGIAAKYRGMNVLEWSILNNDPIGVTLHYIDEGIDTGDIIKFKEIKATKNDSIKTLEKSNLINVELITEYIDNLLHVEKTQEKNRKLKMANIIIKILKMSLEDLNIVESKLKNMPKDFSNELIMKCF